MTSAVRATVAVVHQMARTGGTLVNRCLGSMRDILVLSEVHPRDPQRKIARQAAAWFQLLGEDDLPWFREVSQQAPDKAFADIVVRLAERAEARGRHLVLRDWSHLDFLGVPFVRDPPLRLLTEDALRDRCELRQAFIVRHPLDQYASCASRPAMGPHLTPTRFLDAYLAFARAAADRGFQRYEDLVENPDQNLQRLCETLRIPFDPGYRERWPSYDKLTGDNFGPSRSFAKRQIVVMSGMSLEPAIRESLRRHHGFQECLTLLGYVDAETQ
jgi:hypothetical protein